MRNILITIILFCTLGVMGQRKDCYKRMQTVDTTYYSFMWRDSTSVLHYDQGYLVIDGLKITCTTVYDTIYSQRCFAIRGIKDRRYITKEIDPRLIIQLTEIKK
jgi:hypothetical protein